MKMSKTLPVKYYQENKEIRQKKLAGDIKISRNDFESSFEAYLSKNMESRDKNR